MPKTFDSHQATITRRRALSVVASCLAVASCADLRFRVDGATERIDLAGFMRMSRVLTGVRDLQDMETGRKYFEALLADPVGAKQLTAVWKAAELDRASSPAAVDDMMARGVYEDLERATVADTITRYWYTGLYERPGGGRTVATYIEALAWRTLGYRDNGPSTCGGVFGHWASAPAIA